MKGEEEDQEAEAAEQKQEWGIRSRLHVRVEHTDYMSRNIVELFKLGLEKF